MKLSLRLGPMVVCLALALMTATVSGPTPAFAKSSAAKSAADSSWANEAVQSLVKSGVMVGYPDGRLRPSNPVTRAEFAKIAAKAFGIEPTRDEAPFPDIKGHPLRHWIAALAERKIIKGFPDGKFHPNDTISRAELAAMMTRLLQLPEGKGVLGPDRKPSYGDVSADSWAFSAVETARQLGLVPPYVGADFGPTKHATRADAAYMVYSATRLQKTVGTITAIDTQFRTLTVTPAQSTPAESKGGNGAENGGAGATTGTGDGEAGDASVARFFPVQDDTLILRNNSQSDLASLLKRDRVTILADSEGTPRLVSAQGLLTKNDLVNKISFATDGLLSPADINDAMSGNWRGVSDQLRLALYTRLLESGLSSEEADSILNRDWVTLEGLARQRLTDALSAEIHLPPDIVAAMLARDWQKLGQLAQIELVQQVLTGLLGR